MEVDGIEEERSCSRAMTVASGGLTESGLGDPLSSKPKGTAKKTGYWKQAAG